MRFHLSSLLGRKIEDFLHPGRDSSRRIEGGCVRTDIFDGPLWNAGKRQVIRPLVIAGRLQAEDARFQRCERARCFEGSLLGFGRFRQGGFQASGP